MKMTRIGGGVRLRGWLAAAAIAWGCGGTLHAQSWKDVGPTTITGGQVSGMGSNNVSGAINRLLISPGETNVAYAGSVNGGVWKTTNLQSVTPTWTPLTDRLASLSIGALVFDSADATHNTIYAGIGAFSSLSRISGALTGLYRTTNGGGNWTSLGAADLGGVSISSAIAQGQVVIAGGIGGSQEGLFRSTNGGLNFSKITAGIDVGKVSDLVSVPSQAGLYYAAVMEKGIYRSSDYGLTWTNVTPAGSQVANPNNNNLKLSVSSQDGVTAVFAGVVTNNQAAGFYRSTDSGQTWQSMDVPLTTDGGSTYGLQPRVKAGGQGNIHYAIAAAPGSTNLIYAGGDRQPMPGEPATDYTTWTNSIGATNYTGRLFRGDASQPTNSQWTPITDNYARPGGPTDPASTDGTGPHADSRAMAFDGNGNLLQGDDGGVFMRTAPSLSTGVWVSKNGNLGVTEVHSIAYDSLTRTLVAGTQDVGALAQTAPGSGVWSTVTQGDGGVQAVDNITLAGSSQSIRYSTYINYQGFTRTTYDSNNAPVSSATLTLPVDGTGGKTITNYSPAFYPKYSLNTVDPQKIAFGGTKEMFVSTNKGDNLIKINAASYSNQVSAMAYGGKLGAVAYTNILYYSEGENLYFTDNAGVSAPNLKNTFTNQVFSLALNPTNYTSVFAGLAESVYWSLDGGGSFNLVGGGLSAGFDLHDLVFLESATEARLFAAGSGGLRASRYASGAWGTWFDVTLDQLPNAIAYDLEYIRADDTIYVGSLGRGVWSLDHASSVVPEPTTTALLAFAFLLAGGLAVRRRTP